LGSPRTRRKPLSLQMKVSTPAWRATAA
jgi:hypothetical protein